MNVLLTGASSKLGSVLLKKLEKEPQVKIIHCLTRYPEKWPHDLIPQSPKIESFIADLTKPLIFPKSIKFDLCIHMAGLTHSNSSDDYYTVNHLATIQLAKALQDQGLKRFWYISSHTAGEGAGAYAESKFRAEKDLLKMTWEQLFIFRPAEVLSTQGKEGLDKFMRLSQKHHICPWLFGLKKIEFSPLSTDFLITHLIRMLKETSSLSLQILKGPQLTSWQFCRTMIKKYKAVPIPVFIPKLQLFDFILRLFKLSLFSKDQIPRLLGQRMQRPSPLVKLEVITAPSPFE